MKTEKQNKNKGPKEKENVMKKYGKEKFETKTKQNIPKLKKRWWFLEWLVLFDTYLIRFVLKNYKLQKKG